MDKIEKFLADLKSTLVKSLETVPDAKPEDMMKSVFGLKGAIENITKAFDMEAEEPSPFVKLMKELKEAVGIHAQVLENVLSNIETLQKGTAVRKSIAGQDGDDEDDTKKKSGSNGKDGDWTAVTKTLLKTGKAILE